MVSQRGRKGGEYVLKEGEGGGEGKGDEGDHKGSPLRWTVCEGLLWGDMPRAPAGAMVWYVPRLIFKVLHCVPTFVSYPFQKGLLGIMVLYLKMSYINMFTRTKGTELRAVIDKHELLILNVYNDVGFTVTVDITDCSSNGGEILAVTK